MTVSITSSGSSFRDTLVIIPALNEAGTIGRLVHEITSQYAGISVAVINDGSTDATGQIARSHGAVVLEHAQRMNYGTSIQTGYKYAWRHGYHYLVQIDGDGQHDVRDIARLLGPVRRRECDLALGSRFLSPSTYTPSLPRRAGILLFRLLLRLFIKTPVSDPTSGFQAMNRRVLCVFTKDYFPTDYPDADVLILLKKQGLTFMEIPVVMRASERKASMHKNPIMAVYYVYKMIMSMFLTQFRTLPMENDPCR